MILHISSFAHQEIEDAALWHEQQRKGLGLEFLAAIHDALAEVEQHPEVFPFLETLKKNSRYRRYLVKRFSYIVIYEIRTHETLVHAVAHGWRRPNYWKRRLS